MKKVIKAGVFHEQPLGRDFNYPAWQIFLLKNYFCFQILLETEERARIIIQ